MHGELYEYEGRIGIEAVIWRENKWSRVNSDIILRYEVDWKREG
jgi:hypothetical protein